MSSHFDTNIGSAFAIGFSPQKGEALSVIPQEQWSDEIESMKNRRNRVVDRRTRFK